MSFLHALRIHSQKRRQVVNEHTMRLSDLALVKWEYIAGQSVTGGHPLKKMLVTEVAVLLRAGTLNNWAH